jgi:2'-5' RNA ligase
LPTVTGLVFDLPHAPWIGDVMRLRASYDSVRLRFPVEITVVGSSGLGWISGEISCSELAHKVQAIARAFSPFRFRFGNVACFPGSTVYYMAPADPEPFHDFQGRLAASDLRFQPTPYTFTPHCTLVELSHDAPGSVHRELMEFRVPEHHIHVGSVSIYTLEIEAQKCYQHERIALGA